MSTQSTKAARRSAKTARGTTSKTSKKSAKSARGTTKTARSTKRTRTTAKAPAKTARSAPAARKTAVKPAAKDVRPVAKAIIEPPSATTAPAPVRAPALAPEALTMMRTFSPPVQPIATIDAPMSAHKYQVGESVYYTSPSFGRAAAGGSYRVVKLLPSEGDDCQYRIKSEGEVFERVAKESQLDRA